jgi:hypothetical protein
MFDDLELDKLMNSDSTSSTAFEAITISSMDPAREIKRLQALIEGPDSEALRLENLKEKQGWIKRLPIPAGNLYFFLCSSP